MKNKPVIAAILCAIAFSSWSALAETKGKSTKGDPLVTLWNDPKDPYVIKLNKDDPTTDKWNAPGAFTMCFR